MKKVGEIIKERRKVKGLTLTQLSRVSGVSYSHIQRIESGERFGSAHIFRKLAHPLGFTELEMLKLAGFLSPDENDTRMAKLKEEIKMELTQALTKIYQRIDNF